MNIVKIGTANYFLCAICRCLTKNCTGMVRIEVLRPVCMELYGECKELGRFMLRSSGHTIAAGVITKVCPMYVHTYVM